MKNDANENSSSAKEFSIDSVITSAVQIPGVRVDRRKFLADMFSSSDCSIQDILDLGPVEAGVSQEILAAISHKLIMKRTSYSSAVSFAAGLPGGIAMTATIPADVLQFFGFALRLAQELSYLYGAQDLWENGEVDNEKVKNQLILYCGVMFGVSGAVFGVRALSSQIAKATLQKLPQQALMKTLWYPIVKQIGNAIGIKITKVSLAGGVSKAIPVVGGVVSGGLNFASMLPMAKRLQATLDSASFGYTQEDFEQDIIEMENMVTEVSEDNNSPVHVSKHIINKEKLLEGGKHTVDTISGLFAKKSHGNNSQNSDDVFDKISRLAELKERGIITQEEFYTKKTELLSRI